MREDAVVVLENNPGARRPWLSSSFALFASWSSGSTASVREGPFVRGLVLCKYCVLRLRRCACSPLGVPPWVSRTKQKDLGRCAEIFT